MDSSPMATNGLNRIHAIARLAKLNVSPQMHANKKVARTAIPLNNAPISGIHSSNKIIGVKIR